MMLQRYYKVLFQASEGGKYNLLSQKVMRSVEEVIVEQEMDLAWQARMKLRISADERGNWSDEHRELMKPFARIRVEIGKGTPPYIPLIDGPVVGHDISMSSEPGESFATIAIHDESVFLNQEQEFGMYEDKTAQQIAKKNFDKAKRITTLFLETTPISISNSTRQRGTPMELLREIAKKRGVHAYVLPGHDAGESIGCFQTLKSHARIQGILPNSGDFASLILLGKGRNIDSFEARTDGQGPAKVMTVSFAGTGKTINDRTSDSQNVDLVGDSIGYESGQSTPVRFLPAYAVGPIEENQTDASETERLSYAIEASGSVHSEIYPNVLQPYCLIQVRGVGPEYSGEYLVTGVTHTITPGKYAQSFKLKGSAIAG